MSKTPATYLTWSIPLPITASPVKAHTVTPSGATMGSCGDEPRHAGTRVPHHGVAIEASGLYVWNRRSEVRAATADEVAAKRVELRALASRHRFAAIDVAGDGMIIVRTDAPGYRDLARFAGEAARLVGAYVQVVTDDVPAASAPTKPL